MDLPLLIVFLWYLSICNLKKTTSPLNLYLITLETWIYSNFWILNLFRFSVLHHTKEEKAEKVNVLEGEIDAAIDQDIEREAEPVRQITDQRTAGMGKAGLS